MDLWYFVTLVGQPELWMASTLVAAILYVYLRKSQDAGKREKTKKVVVLYIAGIWIALSLVFVLKNTIQMPRPCVPCEQGQLLGTCNPYCGSDASFPSGHAAAIFAAFSSIYLATRKKWLVPLLIIPVLISYSRFALGVHYASDIIAGAVIGIAGPCIALLLIKKLPRKSHKTGKEPEEKT